MHLTDPRLVEVMHKLLLRERSDMSEDFDILAVVRSFNEKFRPIDKVPLTERLLTTPPKPHKPPKNARVGETERPLTRLPSALISQDENAIHLVILPDHPLLR